MNRLLHVVAGPLRTLDKRRVLGDRFHDRYNVDFEQSVLPKARHAAAAHGFHALALSGEKNDRDRILIGADHSCNEIGRSGAASSQTDTRLAALPGIAVGGHRASLLVVIAV